MTIAEVYGDLIRQVEIRIYQIREQNLEPAVILFGQHQFRVFAVMFGTRVFDMTQCCGVDVVFTADSMRLEVIPGRPDHTI